MRLHNNIWYPALKAAEMMDISRQRLYVYLKAGRFPTAYKKNGTRWMIEQKDIDAYKRGELDFSGVYTNE